MIPVIKIQFQEDPSNSKYHDMIKRVLSNPEDEK